jgi:hypothetical protein
MGGGDRESAFTRVFSFSESAFTRVFSFNESAFTRVFSFNESAFTRVFASRPVANARTSFRGNARRRLRRQLQNRSMLAEAEVGEQHDPAVGKLDGVVVGAGVIHVDLPEASYPMRDHPGLLIEEAQKKSGLLALDVAVERELGAGKQADGYVRLADSRKSLRRGVPKLCRNQLFSDLGRPGLHFMETVVAHGEAPVVQHPLANP